MPNMQNEAFEVNLLDHNERISTFKEVNLGYTKEQAMNEASRCLNCKHKPCSSSCPLGNDIPAFIQSILEDDLEKAASILEKTSCLPSICSRVCPQVWQCEKTCVRGIKGESVSIGNLERYITDNCKVSTSVVDEEKIGKKVLVIGSGPSGLACADRLVKNGIEVDLIDKNDYLGGVLSNGIPYFRLPKNVLDESINKIVDGRINVKLGIEVGQETLLEDYYQNYDAIYLATGLQNPVYMNIEGEHLNGVIQANDFLEEVSIKNITKDEQVSNTSVVIGGGNVAMDVARTLKRLGTKRVIIVYRRSEDEMPSTKLEIEHSKEEGIEFMTLTNPIRFIGDDFGNLIKIELLKMELGEVDESGRRSPIEVIGSNFYLDVDRVVLSIGTKANDFIKNSNLNIELNQRGLVIVNDEEQTSIENIYAGGDIVTGPSTVAIAMSDGYRAADNIIKKLKN